MIDLPPVQDIASFSTYTAYLNPSASSCLQALLLWVGLAGLQAPNSYSILTLASMALARLNPCTASTHGPHGTWGFSACSSLVANLHDMMDPMAKGKSLQMIVQCRPTLKIHDITPSTIDMEHERLVIEGRLQPMTNLHTVFQLPIHGAEKCKKRVGWMRLLVVDLPLTETR